jgi:hypothetical protein
MDEMSNTLQRVVDDLVRREQSGIIEYGTTVDRTDLSHDDWLRHAYFEAMDMALYIRRALDYSGGKDAIPDVPVVGGGNRNHDDGVVRVGGGQSFRTRLGQRVLRRLLRLRAASTVCYIVLDSMADADGVVSLANRDLAAITQFSATTTIQVINDLVRVGLLERLPPKSRRTCVRIVRWEDIDETVG